MNIRDITRTIHSEDAKLGNYIHDIPPAIRDKDCSDKIWIKNFVFAFTEYTLPELIKRSNECGDIAADICEACLQKSNTDFFLLTEKIFSENKLIKWETRPDQAIRMVSGLSELVMSPQYIDTDVNVIRSCVCKMMHVFTGTKLSSVIGEEAMLVLIACYRERTKLSVGVGRGLVECYDLEWKASTEQITELYGGMYQWIQELDLNEQDAECHLFCATISCLEKDALLAPVELSRIYNHCISKELNGPKFSGYANLAHDIILVTVTKHHLLTDLIKDFIPGTVLLMNCGMKSLEEEAGSAIANIYQQIDLLAQCADDVLQVYLDCKGGLSLGMVLKPLYLAAPERILRKIDQIHESFEDMDDIEKTYMYILLHEIAKKHPENIVPSIPVIVHDLRSASNVHLAFMVIAEVSNTHPAEISKYYKKLLRAWDRVPDVTQSVTKTLGNIGLMSEEDADRCLRAMAKRLQMVGEENKDIVLSEMRRIVSRFESILKDYKTIIGKEHNKAALVRSDSVKLVLNSMENRIPQVLANIEEDDEYENMESPTDDGLNNKSEEDLQQGETGGLQENMAPTVKVVVKPVTSVPKWTRDIARILNNDGEYDWRYLAVRLGYSGADARNCALSSNPTMAILAEWYSTHDNSDATFAIMTALRDMGKPDAAEIVEMVLVAADETVPTVDGEMPDTPCSVFVSYQRDHQPEVEAVKDHLELAGYRCWMDISETEDSDSSLARINKGLRNARIVLCMVTEKYMKSERCKTEVNRATLLNKPIIPMLIEKISWPPEGPMSMVLAQLLYIQFYSEESRYTREKFWPDEKFTELLGQIGYFAVPNGDHPSSVMPQGSTPVERSGDDKLPIGISNDVFISHQWDTQSAATDLHSRLTESGYSCWMNPLIPQNNTPTSCLTEKAIGATKVFVACISTKYFLSPDCKHQFNLADALNKPIALVLVEKGMAWPIAAPISVTLSRFNYVDMREGMTSDKYTSIKGDINHCFRSLKDSSDTNPSGETHVTPTDGAEKELAGYSDLTVSVERSGSGKQTGRKQVYSKAPHSSSYIKQITTSESSRSFPERSPSSRSWRRNPPDRADSDQAIHSSQSRRSAVCSIL